MPPGRLPLQEARGSSGRRQERRKPARIGNRYVFLHGFAKHEKANVTQGEKKALQFAGKVFLDLSPADLTRALQAGVLAEVHCVQQAH